MRRLMQRTSVDLPLPDRPMTTRISPSCTVKDTSAIPTLSLVLFMISSFETPSLSIFMALSG